MQPDANGIIRDQSGTQRLVGYIVDVGQPDGFARAWLDVTDQHTNRHGMLHGGLIAMLMDAACGFMASMELGDGKPLTPLVTVSLTTNFVGPGLVGSRVTAIGRPAGGGRKISYVNGEMTDETGRMIATASGVFKATGRADTQ